MLDNPQGVAVDGQGNLYVSDRSNNRIREVGHAGGECGVSHHASRFDQHSGDDSARSEHGRDDDHRHHSPSVAREQTGVRRERPGLRTEHSTGGRYGLRCDGDLYSGLCGSAAGAIQVASSAGTFNFGMAGIGTAPMVALSPGIITTGSPRTISAHSGYMHFRRAA